MQSVFRLLCLFSFGCETDGLLGLYHVLNMKTFCMLLFWNISLTYLPMPKKFILIVNIQSRKLFLPPVCLSSFVFLSNLQKCDVGSCSAQSVLGEACCVLCPVSPRRDEPGGRWLLHGPELSARLSSSCVTTAVRLGNSKTCGVFRLGSFQIGSLRLFHQSGLLWFCQRDQT